MDQKTIKETLHAAGVKEIDQEDIPWIQYMVNFIEPIMPQLTPSYYKGPKITQPKVYELLTFNWGGVRR